MKTAYVFPGQGSQFPGMGKSLLDCPEAVELFSRANKLIGFDLTDLMIYGSEERLKETAVTQPAIFLHSVACVICLKDLFKPAMVAGHSLGEFSALVATGAIGFEAGFRLVVLRARAMQKACEARPSTMAAVLGVAENVVETVCGKSGQVVPANYNTPDQIVISGTFEAVELACLRLKELGARKTILLQVGGAFHSPLMEVATESLKGAIEATHFTRPVCPIYQNVDARPHTEPDEIKANLILQLTSPVLWYQTVNAMTSDGAEQFIEMGPGKVLQGLIKRIAPQIALGSA